MSNSSGMAAVDEAAATITNSEHTAALAVAREEGRKAGLAEGEKASAGLVLGARAEGATAERARLTGIEQAALPGHDKLLAECKADPTCTPGDAALKFNAAHKMLLAGAHASIQNVETVTGKVAAAVTTQAGAGGETVPQTAEGWKAEWAAKKELQQAHASAEAYANWMQGVADGRVRIFKGNRGQ